MRSRKLSVATRRGEAERKHALILKYLQSHPEGSTPKNIAVETGLNPNTVKSILSRMEGVKRVTRGWYKVAEGGHGTPVSGALSEWCFHNLVLSAEVGDPDHDEVFQFGLVRMLTSIKGGRLTVRLSSDFPLNVSSISFVAGVVCHIFDVVFEEVMVSTVEFNRDFSGLRLDGAKSLSVDSLVEQFKAYQKRRGLRLERKTKVPFKVEDLVDVLSQPPLSVDAHVKLNAQADLLKRLVRVTDRNTEALVRLLKNG